MEELSRLPSIDRLLRHADGLVDTYGRGPATDALRRAVDRAREAVRAGAPAPDDAQLQRLAEADLTTRRLPSLRRVINATGVVLHTNLGRAPLSGAARAAVSDAAGYCDVEYDLVSGRRGSRGHQLEQLLGEATGGAAALAVNNAAAALLLALGVLARDRDVLVSRGELVEIGGSFRLPEILAASGARLVEVGTTNRTRASDYAEAGGDVALILKVHPSNYRITGFAQEASIEELAAVASQRQVPLLYDVGSGLLSDRSEPWLADEPSVGASLAAGADLVCCSGDKLLGGPQAGLLVGRSDLIAACRRHPLARALRLDKLRIAALAATLDAHLREALHELPTWRALLAPYDELQARAERLAAALGARVEAGSSLVGGGAAPERALPSPLVRLACQSPEGIAAALRDGDPPIVVRIDQGSLWVDLRTVDEADDDLLRDRLLTANA